MIGLMKFILYIYKGDILSNQYSFNNFSISFLYQNKKRQRGKEKLSRANRVKKMVSWRGLFFILVFMVMARNGEAQLVENFYSSTCPNLESIVNQVVSTKFSQTFVTVPSTLRLFFHDCFVEVGFRILLLRSYRVSYVD